MRLHFILAIVTAVLLIVTLRADKTRHFAFSQVQAMAEKRAHAKYVPMVKELPQQLKNLTPQQEAGIFWKEAYRLWRSKGLPFQVDFYHISRNFPGGPKINTVDRKGEHPLAYSPTFFNFINLNFNPPLPATLPFAGFYLRYPLPIAVEEKPDSLNGFFSVLGGNYFRVLARDQVYGLSARGVALNTEMDDKKHPEEFPDFIEWWLHEPTSAATSIVLDALLDSPSVTGAYEFTVRPGAQTSVDVRATLFFRQPVQRLGLAPFSSMYLYGENARDHFGDNVHPEIHDSDGVLMNTGTGDWIWRPLQQKGKDHQIYNFMDDNPKGFGLIQRDRDFQHYQDLDAKYNVRPSAWVTPHGDWGNGVVQLIQLATTNTNTDNVVLFWRPEKPPQAGDRIDVSYTIDFYMNDAARPPLAYCKQTLVNCPAPPPPPPPPVPPPAPNPSPADGKAPPAITAATTKTPASNDPKPHVYRVPPVIFGPPFPMVPVPPRNTTPVQFLVDFIGNGIENLPANQPPDLDLICRPNGTYLRESKVEKNGYDNSWRVTFTIIPAKPHVPTELLCSLTRNHKPLTETWTYTWHDPEPATK